MFEKRTLAAVFLAMSTQLAGAEEIYVEWTESGDLSPDYTSYRHNVAFFKYLKVQGKQGIKLLFVCYVGLI